MTVMPLLPMLCLGVAGAALLAACIADLRRFEIPDSLSAAILIAALVFGLSQPGFAWGTHALGFALMLGVGLGLFAAGWMGGGDIKLLVAFAAWTGFWGLGSFLLAVVLAGGVLALVLLAGRAGYSRAGLTPEQAPGPLRAGAPLPYALAIAAGAFWWAWRNWPLV